jgi:DNA-binding LytR/AlgR family response regulator
MPVTAIIADDEPVLRQHLKDLLHKEWPALTIVGMAEDGEEAVRLAKKTQADIAFLDIRMPGKSGLEAAAEINSISRVVFVTAYDQYGVAAFEKEAVDYLLKPVSHDRLAQTVARLQNDFQSTPPLSDQILEELRQTLDLSNSPAKHLQWLKIGQGEGIQLTNVDDVCYFQAADKYTRVITQTGEELIRTSIKKLTTSLDPEKFWRIHRATIVNVSKIKSASRSFTGRYQVQLTSHEEALTVSRTYGHLFKQM